MKTNIFTFGLLILLLTMTACGSQTTPSANPDNTTQIAPDTRELPLSTKLAIGTLKLEGTEYAISFDQAVNLLPLWQVLNNLSSSDSAAPEEVTAVTEQIQESMTAEQLAAIEAMNLTDQDIFATMQELGLVNAPQVNASGTPQPGGGFGGGQGPGGGFGPGGGPPGGGPPDEGPGGGFGGQGLSQEQIATAQARRAEGGGGFGNRMLTPLVEAVIKLLETKAGS